MDPNIRELMNEPDRIVQFIKNDAHTASQAAVNINTADLLISIMPPGLISITDAGAAWMQRKRPLLVPNPALSDADPLYPWYHLISIMQSIATDQTIRSAAIYARSKDDMRWWETLCERLAVDGLELACRQESGDQMQADPDSMLWTHALYPLELNATRIKGQLP